MGIQEIIADGQLLVASAIAVAAGLVSFLSPCVLPLIPGYLAYVSGVAGTPSANAANPKAASKRERNRMVLGSILFVLGFAVVFVILLTLSGAVGASTWYLDWQDVILRVMGVVVIIMGLVFMGAFAKFQRTTRLKVSPKIGLAGAPLLGIVFAIGWAPCLGPTIGTVSLLAMQQGSIGRAALLALLYSLGLGIPFVLAAFGFGWMTQTMTFFKRHIRTVNIVGGVILIILGVLMVTGLWGLIMSELQIWIGGYVTPL
ncbi:cytochrome c biogenesis CcdA family protein [Leucobacter aridicollis]|uniref:Cytochrome c-type biogenesis protein n=1 Tax=Leucobacter aridicollis TaxID=283878 RepID=A0A852R8U7_9MICO|nr:cytochrome c biogenesis protein CcdA [Leucobacter aridicollis]MBL3683094.1 cytochrome c biogenesis protein CcdA [Leucobacter aridicollis]NYD25320.1 cytochrome c-type biogenesis protein [Leucobacter aridicollis]